MQADIALAFQTAANPCSTEQPGWRIRWEKGNCYGYGGIGGWDDDDRDYREGRGTLRKVQDAGCGRDLTRVCLEQVALVLLAAAPGAGQQSSASGVLEHLADTLVRLGRALEVLVGADLLADLLTLKTEREHADDAGIGIQ